MTNLKDIIGKIKDKASQSKAAIFTNPKTFILHLSILKATTHDPSIPPNPKHLTTLLKYGDTSRATASAAIESLMDRLQTTRDSCVAIKCLLTVHYIIKHGNFILQDQLSVYPSNGGKNHLKLSDFKDHSSPLTWQISSWVRWYALYLENLLSTSRVLGFFLGSKSNTTEKEKEEEKLSSLLTAHLLMEFDSLVNLLQQTCTRPDSMSVHENELIDEVIAQVGEDYLSMINELFIQLNEFKQRLSCISFGESVELVCQFNRLGDCKERLLVLSTRKKALIESLWVVIAEIQDEIRNNACREDRRLVVTSGSRNQVSESARFGDRIPTYGDSVSFSSSRFGFQ